MQAVPKTPQHRAHTMHEKIFFMVVIFYGGYFLSILVNV
jgi:hypothetical protein